MNTTIIILTPFKVGSSTYNNRFQKLGLLTLKFHEPERVFLNKTARTIFIFPLRNQLEMFPGGYWQDIHRPNYPYCYNVDQNKILQEDTEK
jgi:hypothetical protein